MRVYAGLYCVYSHRVAVRYILHRHWPLLSGLLRLGHRLDDGHELAVIFHRMTMPSHAIVEFVYKVHVVHMIFTEKIQRIRH